MECIGPELTIGSLTAEVEQMRSVAKVARRRNAACEKRVRDGDQFMSVDELSELETQKFTDRPKPVEYHRLYAFTEID